MKLVKPPWVPKRLTGQWREVFEALRRGRAQLSDYDSAYELAIAHQLCAPLASYALERGDEVPERWRTRLNHVRAQNLIFETCLASLAEQLDALNVPWFVTRGAARLADPLVPDRLCGDVDLYILPKDWPTIEIELAAKPDFERTGPRGEKYRRTPHILGRPIL